MRVLYCLDLYPAVSETYVRTEIEYARAAGVDVVVAARETATASRYCSDVPHVLMPDPTAARLRELAPDVIHAHFLHTALGVVDAAEAARIPLTVRGHSFEWSPKMAHDLARYSMVKRIWLFPHQAQQVPHPKVRPLPCCYASKVFGPPKEKNYRMVLRATSCQPRKDLVLFLETAARCPGWRFCLVLARSQRYPEYVDEVQRINDRLGGVVEILVNLDRDRVADLTGQAGLVLRTHDPSAHPYGQPVSIAEAMASGAIPVVNDLPEPRGWLWDAAIYFDRSRGPEEAATAIRSTERWDQKAWRAWQAYGFAFALGHADDVVLPQVVEGWRDASH